MSDVDPVVKFIKARLDEREALTLAIQNQIGPEQNGSMVLTGEFGALVYRWIDLDGALAAVAATRRIVDLCVGMLWEHEGGPDVVALGTLRLLALPYAGHPDYRQEWK